MKRNILVVLLALAMGLSVTVSAAPRSTLSFKVFDPDGNPVKGAVIIAILDETNTPLPPATSSKKGKAFINNATWKRYHLTVSHPELMLIKADFYVIRDRKGAGRTELMGKEDTFYDSKKSGEIPVFFGGSKSNCTIIMGTHSQWREIMVNEAGGNSGGTTDGSTEGATRTADGFERSAEPQKGEHYEFGEAMQAFEAGDHLVALQHIKSYMAKDMEHVPEGKFILGQCLILNGENKEGEGLVGEYLGDGPDDAFAFDWFGSWLEENNRKKEAGKVYAMATSFITNDVNRMVFIKQAANTLSAGPLRLGVLEMGLEMEPDNLGLLMNLRNEYQSAKRKDEVRALNKRLKRLNPAAAAIAVFEDAWKAFQRGHFKTALRLSTETYDLDESRYDALKMRAVCLEKLKRYVDAGKTYAAYLSLVPDDKDAQLLRQKADVFRSMGKQLEEMELGETK